MKHTPGPWRWERGRLMAGPSVDGAGYPMPEIVQESNYGTTEADKALIAEAPAMLEALRFYRAGDTRCGNAAFDAILTRIEG